MVDLTKLKSQRFCRLFDDKAELFLLDSNLCFQIVISVKFTVKKFNLILIVTQLALIYTQKMEKTGISSWMF